MIVTRYYDCKSKIDKNKIKTYIEIIILYVVVKFPLKPNKDGLFVKSKVIIIRIIIIVILSFVRFLYFKQILAITVIIGWAN